MSESELISRFFFVDSGLRFWVFAKKLHKTFEKVQCTKGDRPNERTKVSLTRFSPFEH